MTKSETQARVEYLINSECSFNRTSSQWMNEMKDELDIKFRDHWLQLRELMEANKLLSTLSKE